MTPFPKITNPDTFIGQYMQYMQAQETPYTYDFWTAVWAISSVIGRDVVVARPRAPVYLNWFILLVAASGVTRKSTAVRHASRLVQNVLDDTAQLIQAKMTPEMLETVMHRLSNQHGKAHVVIAISELVTFLGKEKYAQHMPGLLTDLYDSPERRSGGGTLARGISDLRNVYVTFLSASTPAWLLRTVNPDVVEGGFTSRCLFIMASARKRKIAWPSNNDNTGLEDKLIAKLRGIKEDATQISEITLTPNAHKAFEQWYTRRTDSLDVFNSSFESREDAHVLRLAAILAINDGVWQIEARHIRASVHAIRAVKEDGATLFAGTGTIGAIASVVEKVRDLLIKAGTQGLRQADITRALRNTTQASTLLVVLNTLHELDMVQRFENVRLSTRGRPTTIWRATKLIMARDANDLVMAKISPEQE